MIDASYAEYAWQKAAELLAVDSPTGFTAKAAQWVMEAFTALGYSVRQTVKGGVIVDLGGPGEEDALLLSAHADTLGGMVTEVKSTGCLAIAPLGGLNPDNIETENVRIYTRENGIYEGTVQLHNPSLHVNREFSKTVRTFDTVEVVLDEFVRNAAETRALGIEVGDIVCVEPRTRRTSSGYLKSRFLDDKLCVGILLGLAKYLKDEQVSLSHRLYIHITVYEEVGHGAASSMPRGVTEMVSVDMGCIGDGLTCNEHQVSICPRDSHGPYNYEVVGKLIAAAKRSGADYAVDVYHRYGSDADVALNAGWDVRHGLIGPGVFASHGYERGHMDGVHNTLKLLAEYVKQ